MMAFQDTQIDFVKQFPPSRTNSVDEERLKRPYIADGLDQQGRVVPTRDKAAARVHYENMVAEAANEECTGRKTTNGERWARIASGAVAVAGVVGATCWVLGVRL